MITDNTVRNYLTWKQTNLNVMNKSFIIQVLNIIFRKSLNPKLLNIKESKTLSFYLLRSNTATCDSFIHLLRVSWRTSSGADDMYVINPAANKVFSGNSFSSSDSSPT